MKNVCHGQNLIKSQTYIWTYVVCCTLKLHCVDFPHIYLYVEQEEVWLDSASLWYLLSPLKDFDKGDKGEQL